MKSLKQVLFPYLMFSLYIADMLLSNTQSAFAENAIDQRFIDYGAFGSGPLSEQMTGTSNKKAGKAFFDFTPSLENLDELSQGFRSFTGTWRVTKIMISGREIDSNGMMMNVSYPDGTNTLITIARQDRALYNGVGMVSVNKVSKKIIEFWSDSTGVNSWQEPSDYKIGSGIIELTYRNQNGKYVSTYRVNNGSSYDYELLYIDDKNKGIYIKHVAAVRE